MVYIFTIALSIFNTVFRGYLIKTFWGWFIMSQFPNLPSISVLAAIGLSCFVGAISPWRTPSPKEMEGMDADDRIKYHCATSVGMTLAIALSLGIGWVVHALM